MKKEYMGIKTLIAKGNYDFALYALEGYLEKYPGNSYALKEYASIVRQRGNPQQALKILSECTKEGIHSIREKAYCYMDMGDYERALEEINKIDHKTKTCYFVKTFCEWKLGICDQENNSKAYRVEQLFSFDRQFAIEQIKKIYENGEESSFSENVDVEKLYDYVESVLPDAKRKYADDVMWHYLFYVDHVGYTNGKKSTNLLEVVSLPESYQILTMYPVPYVKSSTVNYENKKSDEKMLIKIYK